MEKIITKPESEDNWENVKESFRLILDKRMLKLIPLLTFRAMSLNSQASIFVNFWCSTMSDMDISNEEKIQKALFTYIPLGFGCMVGSVLYGFVEDKCGNKASILFILAQVLIFNTMIIVLNELHEFNWLAYVTMFGMGCIDLTILTYETQLIGFMFESKIVPFCTKNFLENMTVFILLAAQAIKSADTKEDFRIYFII